MHDFASVLIPKLDFFFLFLTVLFLFTGIVKLEIKRALLCVAPLCVWLAPNVTAYAVGKSMGLGDSDEIPSNLWALYFVVQIIGAALLWPLMHSFAMDLRFEFNSIILRIRAK